MNLTGISITPDHTIPVPELAHWGQGSASDKEIILDWPDYDVIEFPVEFWLDLRNHLKKNKLKLLIFCLGGHGRTGTAIACLLVTIGWKPGKAIEWVRENYCQQAIENVWQEDYVGLMYDQYKARREPITVSATGGGQ